MLPNFLIVGAGRCGTSYMAKNLASHPEVFFPERKELHFFDRDYRKGVEYYKKYFDLVQNKKHKAIGEATPAYMYDPKIPERISKAIPDVKIIVIIRHPVDRTYSHYWNMVAQNNNFTNVSFEDSLNEPVFIGHSRYFDVLSVYYKIFPAKNIYVIVYEDFMSDTAAGMENVYKFIGVDEGFKSPWLQHRINSSGNKLGKSSIMYLLYRISRKLKVPYLAKMFENLNTKEMPVMEDKTRLFLLSQFEESNKLLEQLTGKDLSCWNK